MLAIIRIILAAIFVVIMTIYALIYCLFNHPRNPKHVYTFSRWFHQLRKLIGLTITQRGLEHSAGITNAVYISNHQSVYDFVTTPGMLQPRTVSLGKKSLLWLPFFGQLYWITGNILIDRENKAKARKTIQLVANAIHQRDLSVWVYPEGTRSNGRGLLPFKTGAFRMAIEAGVPIIPVVISTTHNKIDLNKYNNGTVLAEMLPPVDTSGLTTAQARTLAEQCHQLMAKKIAQLDQELTSNDPTHRHNGDPKAKHST